MRLESTDWNQQRRRRLRGSFLQVYRKRGKGNAGI